MVLCSSHMRPLAHTLPLYLFQKEFLHCQVGRTSLGHWDGGCVLSNHLQSQELPGRKALARVQPSMSWLSKAGDRGKAESMRHLVEVLI